jgi:hypothetical protein
VRIRVKRASKHIPLLVERIQSYLYKLKRKTLGFYHEEEHDISCKTLQGAFYRQKVKTNLK